MSTDSHHIWGRRFLRSHLSHFPGSKAIQNNFLTVDDARADKRTAIGSTISAELQRENQELANQVRDLTAVYDWGF